MEKWYSRIERAIAVMLIAGCVTMVLLMAAVFWAAVKWLLF